MENTTALFFILFTAFAANFIYWIDRNDYRKDRQPQEDKVRYFSKAFLYLQVSTLIIAVGSCLWPSGIWLVLFNTPFSVSLGISIISIALALLYTAKINLGSNFSPCDDAYVPKDIVQEGLYKYIRHPIYTANLGIILGAFVMTGSTWLAVNFFVLLSFYLSSIHKEEEALSQQFEEYAVYQKKTGKLLPKLNA